jgi:DNA ligase (NAD+)
MANPRNAAAGALRNHDPLVARARKLHFVAYDWRPLSKTPAAGTTFQQLLLQACRQGFPVIRLQPLQADLSMDDYRKWARELDADQDGLVLRVNDLHEYEQLGWVSGCPRGAIAYKFPAERAQTTVRTIEWQTSRNGRVVPTLVFDEVSLAGTKVSRATGNNWAYIEERRIGPGATVKVCKANEIIPQIVEVLQPSDQCLRPEVCPSCKTPLKCTGVHLQCANQAGCPAQLVNSWVHALSTLGVLGVAEAGLDALLARGGLHLLGNLEERLAHAQIDGQQAEVVRRALQQIPAQSPGKVLQALGIPSWGATLCLQLPDAQALSLLQDGLTATNIPQLPNVGESRLRDLKQGLEDRAWLRQILLVRVPIKQADAGPTTGALAGKSVCITGTLPISRTEAQSLMRSHGAVIKESVVKGLDYLVAGEAAGSKLDKAQKLGAQVLTWEQLQALLQPQEQRDLSSL